MTLSKGLTGERAREKKTPRRCSIGGEAAKLGETICGSCARGREDVLALEREQKCASLSRHPRKKSIKQKKEKEQAKSSTDDVQKKGGSAFRVGTQFKTESSFLPKARSGCQNRLGSR